MCYLLLDSVFPMTDGFLVYMRDMWIGVSCAIPFVVWCFAFPKMWIGVLFCFLMPFSWTMSMFPLSLLISSSSLHTFRISRLSGPAWLSFFLLQITDIQTLTNAVHATVMIVEAPLLLHSAPLSIVLSPMPFDFTRPVEI